MNDRETHRSKNVSPKRQRTLYESLVSFWRRDSARRLMFGFASIQVVVLYSVAGYLMLGWSLSDSVYQVVITISGVGFTEVHPLLTHSERFHTMAVIVLGLLSVAFTLGCFVQFLNEGEFQKYFGQERMLQQLETVANHTIVAGYGRVGALVCEELASVGHTVVVIDLSPTRIADVQSRGHLCVQGDATEEKVLLEAGVDRAIALVTVMPDDAKNVFITLTVRQMGYDLTIIGQAEQPSSPKKLRQAGADHVVMPAGIGAHRIVSLITNPKAVEFAELVTKRSSLQIEMDEVPLLADHPLIGRTLRIADIGRRTGVIVVAIKRADGRVEFPPQADEILGLGDSIVILGRHDNLATFQNIFLKN